MRKKEIEKEIEYLLNAVNTLADAVNSQSTAIVYLRQELYKANSKLEGIQQMLMLNGTKEAEKCVN